MLRQLPRLRPMLFSPLRHMLHLPRVCSAPVARSALRARGQRELRALLLHVRGEDLLPDDVVQLTKEAALYVVERALELVQRLR